MHAACHNRRLRRPAIAYCFRACAAIPVLPCRISGARALRPAMRTRGRRTIRFLRRCTLVGQFGTASQADYYEVEYTPHGTAAWTPLPSSALLDFNRSYFDATLPIGFQYPPAVPFPVKTFGTKHVYESRHHYEVNHPPANWGSPLTGRAWYQNVNELAYIETANTIVDGTYDFRIVGYRALGGGGVNPGPDESTRKVIDGCGGSADNNLLVLRLDNRTPFSPVAGTVHLPTSEPDCGITHVRIGGVNVGACGFQQLQHGTPLEIEFFATDPDGHLDHYELVAEHGLGATANLLNAAEVGAFTLTATSGGPKGRLMQMRLRRGPRGRPGMAEACCCTLTTLPRFLRRPVVT